MIEGDMDIAKSLGDKADYKSNKLEYDKLIVQKNIKNDLLQSMINKLPMDKMARTTNKTFQ